jgi:cysteine protease ATG4
MMALREFRGIIGGKPKKALYFLGRHNTDYIYLDPHYVQKAKLEIAEIETSYVCESFRKCPNTSIDASLGVCFYIKDLQELNSFYDGIKQIKEKDSEGMFIFSADTTPNYMKKERSEAIELENEDDTFQEL